jgi:hypothetical protein
LDLTGGEAPLADPARGACAHALLQLVQREACRAGHEHGLPRLKQSKLVRYRGEG